MREILSQSEKVSASLVGKFGEEARRWKGENAGYVAKHLWITKHFRKLDHCQNCGTKDFSRLEWANISGKYKRDRMDYLVLCPSCHRKIDLKKLKQNCPKGHPYAGENLLINCRGHRICKICSKDAKRRYRKNVKNNKI